MGVLSSKLADSTPAVTIDRQCGSSQQAIQFAAQAVMSGTQDVVIASGVESMTRVPMGSNIMFHAKEGLGQPMSPDLQAKYPGIQFSQFMGAEMIAEKHGFSKDMLDQFAFESRVETEGTNSLSDTFTDGFANFPMYHLRARKNLKNTLRAHG